MGREHDCAPRDDGIGVLTLPDLGDGHHYLDQYGHVQSVDQVLTLDEGLDRGLVDDGDVVLFLAAGTGYTWAASVLRGVN